MKIRVRSKMAQITLYLLKRKKNINHLYAFRKEQHIKNNYRNCYDYQDVIKSFLFSLSLSSFSLSLSSSIILKSIKFTCFLFLNLYLHCSK